MESKTQAVVYGLRERSLVFGRENDKQENLPFGSLRKVYIILRIIGLCWRDVSFAKFPFLFLAFDQEGKAVYFSLIISDISCHVQYI